METTTQVGDSSVAHAAPKWPSLKDVTRPSISTAQAAYYLNRQPQTLRGWACYEDGPLRPTRVHGRLLWSVAAIRRLLEPEVLA